MSTEERFERIETIAANTAANLDKLTQVTAAIAASVAARDEQIESFIRAAEINRQKWEQLRREFQAYLTTIHPRQ
jgi:hypothetical protein